MLIELLEKYRKQYQDIFEKNIKFNHLILSYYLSFTTFEHIALDGTIIKAFNSPFNILKMDDITTLINHFTKRKIN